MATQPLSLRKFIMCFLCVLSRFGGYRVLTCTPCRRNRLSCKKEKRIVPLKCGHKFQWSTLQYNRRIIAGKRHQSLKSKWQSSKWLRTHRLLSKFVGGGGGGAQTLYYGMKTQYILATVGTYTFCKEKHIGNARKKLLRNWTFSKRSKLLTITSSCYTAPPSITGRRLFRCWIMCVNKAGQ